MQLKKMMLWSVLALILFLLMLLATMPARVVTRVLPSQVPGLAFASASGTIWRGSTSAVYWQDLVIPEVSWQLSPWHLLTGAVNTDLQFGQGQSIQGQLTLHARATEQQLKRVDIMLPANELRNLSPMPGVQLHGTFRLDAETITLADNQLKAITGRLQWRDAKVQTPLGQPPLGSYAVQLQTDEQGTITGEINDLEGVLDLQGQLRYSAPTFSINATCRTDLPEQLDRFFRAVARRDGNRYQITWQQAIKL